MAKKKETEKKTKKTSAKKSTAVASKKTPAKKTPAKKSSKEASMSEIMHQDEHLDVQAAGLMLDMLDEELDAGEKKFGISSTLLDPNEPKISTGLLALDLILFGGLRSGGWYTVFGGEQSAKSTLITWLSAAMIKIGFHKQGRGAWFDCEGSSDPVYINNIMQNMGITKKDATDIFGVRDPETGEYLKKPLIRFYQEDNGEVVFDMLNKFKRSLPTIEKQGKEYYYILDNTNPNKARFKGMYDTKYLTKHNKLKIPGAPSTPQAIVLMDSYVAMLPEGLDKDDANGSMAIQARMFSDGIKRVKGGMRKKRMIVFGVNQLRLRPAVMNQNPEYEPGGEALKFFCMKHDTRLFTERGLITAEDYSLGDHVSVLGESGIEQPTIFKSMGYSQIRGIKTQLGNKIEGKPNHRVYALRESGTDPEWLALKDISTGNNTYVPVKYGADVWARDVPVFDFEFTSSKNNDTCTAKLPKKLTKKFALLLGMLSGDGHVDGTGIFHFVTGDSDSMDAFVDAYYRTFGGDDYQTVYDQYVKRNGNKLEFRLYSRHISDFLVSLGVTGYSRTKKVPHCIRTAPRQYVVQFLRGLFDADGCIGKSKNCLSTVSKDLAEDVQLLLLNMGIITRIETRRMNYHHSKDLDISYNVHMIGHSLNSFIDQIGVVSQRKTDNLFYVNPAPSAMNPEYLSFNVFRWRQTTGKIHDMLTSLYGENELIKIEDLRKELVDFESEIPSFRTKQERDAQQAHVNRIRNFLDYTQSNNLLWVKVTESYEGEMAMTYDGNMPDTHTFVTNGIVSHNSDVRLRAVARAHSGAPWSWDGLNSQMIQEESKTGEGKDTYRFINITTQKNKLGGTPSQQTWLRLWVADENGQARGFCPVFDTFYYMYALGLVSGTKNNMKFHSSVPLHGAKKCSWNKFKRLVLGTNAEIKEVCEELGLEKAGNIRKWCFTHIQKAGMKRYRDVLAGKTSKDDSDDDE